MPFQQHLAAVSMQFAEKLEDIHSYRLKGHLKHLDPDALFTAGARSVKSIPDTYSLRCHEGREKYWHNWLSMDFEGAFRLYNLLPLNGTI